MDKKYKVLITFEKIINVAEVKALESHLKEGFFAKAEANGWKCKVEKSKCKTKKYDPVIKIFEAEQILALVRSGADKFYYDKYCINIQKNRYRIFAENHICVCCGLEGSLMILEKQQYDAVPHFNLYGINQHDQKVLMTKDHVIPSSRGGNDANSNLQTMCFDCNNLKSNTLLNPEQIRDLKEVMHNYHHKVKSEKDRKTVINLMKFFLENDK